MVVGFGVNVTVYDEWPQFFYLFYLKHGVLSFQQLWLDGNLHRQFFSRLLSFAFELASAGNAKIEMFGDAVMMITAFGILATHLRRTYHFSSVAIAIAASIVLSADQVENLVNGCDNSSDLVLLTLVGAGVLLDIGTTTTFVTALGLAVVGSYSLFQGLFVWPAGAMYLALKRRWTHLAAWLLVSTTVVFFYFYQIHWEWANPTRVPLSEGFLHPFSLVAFALGMLGTITGSLSVLNSEQATPAGWWIAWLLMSGGTLVVLTVAVTRTVDIKRIETPFAAYFATIGISFVLATSLGRVSSGWFGSNVSRYATLTMLLLLALWIIVHRTPSQVRKATAAFAIVAYVTSFFAALSAGARTMQDRLIASDVLTNLAARSSADVGQYVGYPSERRIVRSFAEFEYRYGLGSFAAPPIPAQPSTVNASIGRTPVRLPHACEAAIRGEYLADAARLAARPLEVPASFADEPACRDSITAFTAGDAPGIVPAPGPDFFLNGGLAWDDGPPADIHVWGDGTTLDLYASMEPIDSRNLRLVKLTAIADDRSVRSGQMCIYAAWDRGASPQTCVPADGSLRRIETAPITLDSSKPFWFVAHFSNVAPDYDRLVSFDDPLIVPLEKNSSF